MANTNIDLVGLDFNSLKTNLKTFLKNNTQFKDLDYEGSNMNVLLDLLAYNTYLNGFYTNMVASEMFMDTAQLRDSIVSHAKELNYVPRSFTGAQAKITVDITPATSVSSIVVPKYTSFTTRLGSNTYSFSTNESMVLTSSSNGVFSMTVDVFEGITTTENFVLNYSNTSQRFVLSNPTIDTSSMTVVVYEDNGQTAIDYVQAESLLDVTSSTKAYFLQAAENQQYEIVFGDNVFGQKPKDGSIVSVKYRACSGELPNGASTFAVDSAIDGHTNVAVTTVTSAAGGAVNETIESIRYNAPRAFQAQGRAVTTTDYETLLKNKFSDIQAISVYGGEDHDPPQFGKVFISVDVANADGAPESRKAVYLDYIKTKTLTTIQTEFIDPEFTYVKVDTKVDYNTSTTTKTTADIKTLVQAAISNYSSTSLQNFKTKLQYSALVKAIDAAEASIVGNDTTLTLVKRFVPILKTSNAYTISAFNPIETETGVELSGGDQHFGHALTSSQFTYQGIQSVFVDDSLGNVYIGAVQGSTVTAIRQVGTIDYTTGKVVITSIVIDAYEGNYIEMRFVTASKNIVCDKNVILQISPEDVTVTVTGVKQ
jgi:hypothetical protein